MKFEEALKILESSYFDQFVGVFEDLHFECKGVPYQLAENREKQELAKDVCGFANSAGGIIVIGLETEISPEHPGEKVSRVRPFLEDLMNVKQYRDVLSTWIYPPISDLKINWYPCADNSSSESKGIGVIIVPRQEARSFPFLITRYVDEKGKSNEFVFGFSQRKLDEVHHHSVQRIHHLIQQGMTYESLALRLDTIESLLIGQIEGGAVVNFEEEIRNQNNKVTETRTQTFSEKRQRIINKRLSEALSTVQLETNPAFILYVFPIVNTSIPDLLASRNSESASIIRNPPQLRYHGFGLETDQEPIIVKGQLRRSMIAKYKIVEVWKDGALFFIATGDNEFLCWGKRKSIRDNLRINPITLIESTYLFCESSRQLFELTEPKTPPLKFGISLKNVKDVNSFCGLSPGAVGTIGWKFGNNLISPPESDFTFEYLWKDGQIKPELLAYFLVREIYAWYGLEYEKMPYTKTADGITIIDIDTLKSF
jgi:hypothetical protein